MSDLLLLDLNLSKYSGIAVLGKIKASSKCSSLKVIVITSSNSLADRADAARLDAMHYFLKANDVSEFLKIASVVRGQHVEWPRRPLAPVADTATEGGLRSPTLN